ncbi:hypothetical protein [Arthrobacter methylotrophus]
MSTSVGENGRDLEHRPAPGNNAQIPARPGQVACSRNQWKER